MEINTYNLWLRVIILTLAVIGFVSFWIWGRRTKTMAEASLVFLWLMNVITFHLYRIFVTNPNVYFLNNWSLGIHLQAVLSLAFVGVLLARSKD